MAGLTREYMSQVEVVGYVICIYNNHGFKDGYVYKVRGVRLDYEEPYFCIEVELDSVGSTTNGWNSKFFKLPDDKLAVKVYEGFGKPMKVDDYCLFDGKVIHKPGLFSQQSSDVWGKAVDNVKNDFMIPFNLFDNIPSCWKSISTDKTPIINEYDTFSGYILPEYWYTKIKIGDKLKCVVSDNIRDKGAGWENGLVFEVDKIDYFYDSNSGEKHYVFFRSDNKLGVYMAHCKPVKSENLLKHIQERNIDDILSDNVTFMKEKLGFTGERSEYDFVDENLVDKLVEGKSILRVNKKSKKDKVKFRAYDTIIVGKLSFKKKDKFNVKLNKYYE